MQLRTSRSTDSGATFGNAANLGTAAFQAWGCHVAADGNGGFTVVWAEQASGGVAADVFRARSTDGGQSFGAAANVSANAGVSVNPRVAGGAGDFVIQVWEDDSAQSGTSDILSY